MRAIIIIHYYAIIIYIRRGAGGRWYKARARACARFALLRQRVYRCSPVLLHQEVRALMILLIIRLLMAFPFSAASEGAEAKSFR